MTVYAVELWSGNPPGPVADPWVFETREDADERASKLAAQAWPTDRVHVLEFEGHDDGTVSRRLVAVTRGTFVL